MKILYLGTGAAEGVPAVFCNCDTCREARRRGEKEFHSRSQVLIDGELSVDFPPDAYYHSLRFGADLSAVRYLLVTHSHMDHFYAHDFILRGYKYSSPLPAPLHIFGNEEVKRVFDECTRREMRPDVLENIRFSVVRPFEPFSFGDYTAVALKAQHSRTECALLYLVEKCGKCYLHLTDTGRIPRESLDYLGAYLRERGRRADLVSFDCTFLFFGAGEVSRHMGLPDCAAMRGEFLRRGVAGENHPLGDHALFPQRRAPVGKPPPRGGGIFRGGGPRRLLRRDLRGNCKGRLCQNLRGGCGGKMRLFRLSDGVALEKGVSVAALFGCRKNFSFFFGKVLTNIKLCAILVLKE